MRVRPTRMDASGLCAVGEAQRWAPAFLEEDRASMADTARRTAPEASPSSSSLSTDLTERPCIPARGLSSCGLGLMDDASRTARPACSEALVADSRWTVSDPNITGYGDVAALNDARWADGFATWSGASGCSSPRRASSEAPSADLRSAVREALLLVEGLRQQQERLLRRLDEVDCASGAPREPSGAATSAASAALPASAFGAPAAAAAAANAINASSATHGGPRSADVASLADKQLQQQQHLMLQCRAGDLFQQQPQVSLSAVDSPVSGQYQQQKQHGLHAHQQHESLLSQLRQPHLRINTTRCSPRPHQHPPHPQHHSQPHQQLASTPRSAGGPPARCSQAALHHHRSLHRPHHHHHLHLRASLSGRFRVGFTSPGASPPNGRTSRAVAAAGSPGAVTCAGGSHVIPEDAAACMGAVVEVSASCGGGGCAAGGGSAGGAAVGSSVGAMGSRRRSRLSLIPFSIELAAEEEARREQELYTVCSAFATLAAAAAVDEPEGELEQTPASAGAASAGAAGAGALDGFAPRCASVADVAPIIAAYSCAATPLRLRGAVTGGGGGTCSGADERGVAPCGSDDGEADQEQYGWLYSSDDEEDADRPTRGSMAAGGVPLLPPPASGGGGGGVASQQQQQQKKKKQPSRFSWADLFTAPLRAFPGVTGLHEDGADSPLPCRRGSELAGGEGGRAARCDTPPPSQPPPQRAASTCEVGGSGVVGGSSFSAAGSGLRTDESSSWATEQLTRSHSRGHNSRSGAGSGAYDQQDVDQGARRPAAGSPTGPQQRSAQTAAREDGSASASDPASAFGSNSCGGGSGAKAACRPVPPLSLFSEGGAAASRRNAQLSSAGGDGGAGSGVPASAAVPSRYSWRRLTRC